MKQNIDKIRNGFFKKSLSVGHHNIKYTWMQLMLVILNCIRGLESFEEGATAPSPQTLRDRLHLDGGWLEYFHQETWHIAVSLVKRLSRIKWYISVDETHEPFFGNRKKLNKILEATGLGKLVHSYKAKTPGATGAFCFLAVSICCSKIRIPLFVKMVAESENYKLWLEEKLKQTLSLAPHAIILADRGFGKATWFYLMLDRLNANYVVRIPLRKKENKNKVESGATKFQYWMKDKKTKEKTLLTVSVAKDEQNRKYLLASNLESKTPRQMLAIYMNRWDIENLFKDTDRAELPTSSRNPKMRLFSVVAALLLFTLWQLERVLRPIRESLRHFIKKCINTISQSLNYIITVTGILLQTFNIQPP